jgi:hypothetical protein
MKASARVWTSRLIALAQRFNGAAMRRYSGWGGIVRNKTIADIASRAVSACAATDVWREMHRKNTLGSTGGESASEKGANGGRSYVMVNTEEEMDA